VISRRVVVHGHVQGVFFRDRCRREADRLGVSGWVRNRPDGAVEALFEGRPEDVEELVEWMHHGPPHAAVERVDVTDEDPTGRSGFVVRG